MAKFQILQPTSTDAGTYNSMKDFEWEGVVEGEYIDERKKGIYVRGDEFIRLGGCPEAFAGNFKHHWGTYEEVS
jgi:hypothetical protein